MYALHQLHCCLNDYKTDYQHGCWTWNKPMVVVCLVVVHVFIKKFRSTDYNPKCKYGCWPWNKPVLVVRVVVGYLNDFKTCDFKQNKLHCVTIIWYFILYQFQYDSCHKYKSKSRAHFWSILLTFVHILANRSNFLYSIQSNTYLTLMFWETQYISFRSKYNSLWWYSL